MWLTFVTVALADTPPAVRIEWRKHETTVRVDPPADQKIATEAPARLTLAWGGSRAFDLAADGEVFGRDIAIADLRGAEVRGTLEVGLCGRDGAVCRPTAWKIAGVVPEGKRGAVGLAVAVPHAETPVFGPEATDAAVTAAFARARATGRPVLLDFSAVWCPPCNLLAAEVLHGEPSAALEAVEVAVLDVDHPSSFALKDRYDVGGYPTVIVVDPDGTEHSRTVGYTDRGAFLAWLAGAASSTDGADLAGPVEALAPDRAAELAWAQLRAGDEARATVLLARAQTGSDTVAYHLARVHLKGEASDAEWLLAHAPERAPDWVSVAVEGEDRARAARVVELALRHAEGTALADVLSAAATLQDEAGARVLHAAAVSVVRSAMVGDQERDKGWITWLAQLLEDSGDPEAAVGLLTESVAAWPAEPTFDLALAPLLKDLDRLEEALVSAERAVKLSWGDNRLRAVATQAEILVALGRLDEATTVARAELAAQPAPENDVRTHRYRTRLEGIGTPSAQK